VNASKCLQSNDAYLSQNNDTGLTGRLVSEK